MIFQTLGYLLRTLTGRNTPKRIVAALVHTVDGDTARFWTGSGDNISVRFLGVDTPEMGFERINGKTVVNPRKQQHGAVEATRFVDRLLRDANTITLEIDPARAGSDHYGRVRAWVWADGVLVQEALVQHGLAKIVHLNPFMLHAKRLKTARRQRWLRILSNLFGRKRTDNI